MNLNDAERILQIEAAVKETQQKMVLIEEHLDIDYDEAFEKLQKRLKKEKAEEGSVEGEVIK